MPQAQDGEIPLIDSFCTADGDPHAVCGKVERIGGNNQWKTGIPEPGFRAARIACRSKSTVIHILWIELWIVVPRGLRGPGMLASRPFIEYGAGPRRMCAERA